MNPPPKFTIDMHVRDYECDVQGIVNNAVYLNYLEHARHKFLASLGVDFVGLAGQGTNLVVTRAEVDYIRPLRPGDDFTVTVTIERISRLRLGFRHEIIRSDDGTLVLRALVVGTAIDARGRPCLPPGLSELLGV